ncbi:YceI family protein [Croceitalea dokdonensis]|nr:YceI family protein [Croceitalea dokdonensis]
MKYLRLKIIVYLLFHHLTATGQSDRMICRQGNVTFFSYTAVENIEAVNNQVVSVADLGSGEIAVQMLMRAFVFKKALMEEHFNESYVESDIFPKLTFTGNIEDFINNRPSSGESRMIRGLMDFHGVQKQVLVKTKIEMQDAKLVLSGNFNVLIDDFDIKVPALLVPNISKEIQITYRFEYEVYED